MMVDILKFLKYQNSRHFNKIAMSKMSSRSPVNPPPPYYEKLDHEGKQFPILYVSTNCLTGYRETIV